MQEIKLCFNEKHAVLAFDTVYMGKKCLLDMLHEFY